MAARARTVAVLLAAGAALAVPAALPAGAPAPAPAASSAPAVAASLPRGLRIGIGDQKPDMFSDARFTELGVKHARLAIGWDALGSRWQVAELDRWLADARAHGITPLISIGHSRTSHRSLPSTGRYRSEFRRLRRRYPWVKTFATWNEANHCGEPTCHRPKLVAAYYRALRRECPGCTILAPEMLDLPNVTSWVRRFRSHLGYTPRLWGLHNYVEANRFRMTRLRAMLRALPGARVWLTETGGLVRRDNGSTIDIPEGPGHAGNVTRYLFDRLLPANPRVRAVYIYHWNAGPLDVTWDSGLITPGGQARPSLFVLRRVLRFGLRPYSSAAPPGR